MTSRTSRRYDRDFKLRAVGRMEAGENVAAMSRELGVRRKLLYDWRRAFRLGGAEALRGQGRPGRDERVIAARDREPSALVTPPSGYAVRTREADELAAARQRIGALERLLGQQALELDFFKSALLLLESFRRPSEAVGGSAPSSSSASGRSGRAREGTED